MAGPQDSAEETFLRCAVMGKVNTLASGAAGADNKRASLANLVAGIVVGKLGPCVEEMFNRVEEQETEKPHPTQAKQR